MVQYLTLQSPWLWVRFLWRANNFYSPLWKTKCGIELLYSTFTLGSHSEPIYGIRKKICRLVYINKLIIYICYQFIYYSQTLTEIRLWVRYTLDEMNYLHIFFSYFVCVFIYFYIFFLNYLKKKLKYLLLWAFAIDEFQNVFLVDITKAYKTIYIFK